MVVTMRTLTRPSLGSQATCVKLEERTDASLVRTASAEPLNATSCVGLSSAHMVEGKHDSGQGEAAIGRIPVVSKDGTPLMPCTSTKARKLLELGKARKQWSKLGIFHIQLHFNPTNPTTQPLAIGVDSGSKFEGFSVVGTKDTVLNIMSEAVTWVSKAVKQRNQMRRGRRYRNTRRRPCRGNNRLHRGGFFPPSTKARWDAKLRIIKHLKTILPVKTIVVEDIKAWARKGQRRWNRNFSPLEVGKKYFYRELRKMGLVAILKTGIETQALRERFDLKKIVNKSKPIFESHCVDAWVLAASETDASHPTAKAIYYAIPLRWHRRQLHRLEAKGGVRRRYGGTLSLGLKKGTLVKHGKFGLCYVGGNRTSRLSLHSLSTGRRLTRDAKREDFKILTRIGFRTQFLPRINSGVSLFGSL